MLRTSNGLDAGGFFRRLLKHRTAKCLARCMVGAAASTRNLIRQRKTKAVCRNWDGVVLLPRAILHGVISDIATKAEVAMLHKEAVNHGKTGGPRTFIGTGYIGSEAVTGYETPYERAQVGSGGDAGGNGGRSFPESSRCCIRSEAT